MNAKDDGKAKRRAKADEGEADTEPGTEVGVRNPAAAALESQDDLAYVTGQRDPKDADKQVRSPDSRRQGAKAKEPAGGEQP